MNRAWILEQVRDRVYRRAERHAERYSDPEYFLKNFQTNMTDLRDSMDGGPLALDVALNHRETLSLCAEIEALAAFRMLSSVMHTVRCKCFPCRTR